MKRAKLDSVVILTRLRSLHFLMGLVFLYFILIITQFPLLFRFLDNNHHHHHHRSRLLNEHLLQQHQEPTKFCPNFLSNLAFQKIKPQRSDIYRSAMQASILGTKSWAELIRVPARAPPPTNHKAAPACPAVVSVSGSELKGGSVGLPCGLTIGSHITVVGKPRRAHAENETRISETKGAMVSQSMLELRRKRVGRNEEPATARLLHFNPRIKGDWSGKPVIEMNNCYRGQWGTAVRCEGWRSSTFEETVDGQVKCERWIHDANHIERSQASLWLNKLMGRKKEVEVDWRYPFSEEKFFVLTVSAGLEGYHISVDGRHITSFPYRTGSDLEDAMLLYVYGDIDMHSVFAASLPTAHPGIAPERHLEMSDKWKAQPLPSKPVTLFIGVLSSGDHFAERMAVRKSWMQHFLIRSSSAVVRFFVALHEEARINMELIKEAEFFGDIVIVPYLDTYDLVVLKTLAICEYGVNKLSVKYIMKCDDDTFVRVDAVVEEARSVDGKKSLYAGKMNYYHKPLRNGKWAVTNEEWAGEVYPPYADGAGYIISSDIARFIVLEFERSRLRLFKMEDVSMGMWVEQFNTLRPVVYLHNEQFRQSGCVDDYYTAHYQSPKQMICLWEVLESEGKPRCCSFR